MDTDDIGGLANLLSDSRASGGVGCGIVHSSILKRIIAPVPPAFLQGAAPGSISGNGFSRLP